MGWALNGLIGSLLGLHGPYQSPRVRLMDWLCKGRCHFVSPE